MKLSIRVVPPADRDEKFYAAIAPFFMSRAVRKEMPYLQDTDSRIWFLALNPDSRTLGIAGLDLKEKTSTLAGHFYLSSLYVLPEFRKHGVGHALLEARLKRCLEGLDVRTMCVPEIAPAYLRRGFQAIFTKGKYTHMKRAGR
jgi:GNAT superfamily N-acetyltransferase